MFWSYIWNNILNLEPGIVQIALRLACAMLVGLVIGIEREYTNRPAGMRTHILVALGACAVSITGEMLFSHYSDLGATPDPARLSAQVIAGVSFLGAGTIIREGATVKGLTTAASVWTVACLGIAAGFGYYALALTGMLFVLITLTVFESLQRKLINAHSAHESYALVTTDLAASLALINERAQADHAILKDIGAEDMEDGTYRITFQADFSGSKTRQRDNRFFNTVAAAPETKSLRQIGEETGAKV